MKLRNTLLLLLCLVLVSPAMAQIGARPGSQSDNTPPQQPLGTTDEGFEDIAALLAGGWESINTSDAIGTVPDWFQPDGTVFEAQAGPIDSYAAANFNSTAGSQISNWLLVPDVGFLESATFWTRTVTANTFPDRMQVRFSSVGGSNVGTDVNTVGDYTDLLVDINDTLAAGGYPDVWTEFTVNPGAAGRLAFRYFVPTDAGPVGNNSNFIGVDTLSFVIGEPDVLPPPPAVPTLGWFGLTALALLLIIGTVVMRRRQEG
ncbi:MAG: choice-of-anchor J domain-containing protein [Gammaproteobacteria bacterium]|nr:choice-of-anchor J domain-containing protein [Gammaproteobacteria bacterium]